MLVSNMLKWYKNQLFRSIKQSELSLEEIKAAVLNLGNWLKDQRYKGKDVSITNSPERISTSYSFSLIGWMNLYKLYGKEFYLEEAKHCLHKILEEQQPDGEWLFPYKFRNNPAYFPYACENFMTLESLLSWWHDIEQRSDISKSIEKNLMFLRDYVGYSRGAFWYSPTDKIKVPNVSSMAANVFGKAYILFNDKNYLRYTIDFVNYCISNQTPKGAFPYFEGKHKVYIPYHALEIWELKEANMIINSKKVNEALRKATEYLTHHFQVYSYSSYNVLSIFSIYMLKTPLWAAKAYLAMGDFLSALKHFSRAVYLFEVPRKPYFFNYIECFLIKQNAIPLRPILSSVFIRYNASCFEIGSRLLTEYSKYESSRRNG